MNAINEFKSKAISFESKHRIIPKAVGAVSAAQLMLINASAEEGAVDISTVTDSMTSSLVDLAGKVGLACAGVVGAGLTIFGLKWAVVKVMAFFKAIGK